MKPEKNYRPKDFLLPGGPVVASYMYRGQPQIKLGLVPHPALTRRPGDPPFLLHRTQGEVQI